MAGIFKAYDIRGIYGEQLNEEVAKKIGRAFVTFLDCKKVLIAQDMRPHSQPLFEALSAGITMQGADIINIGLASSPMAYYANGFLECDAGIMITASHNAGEWNGFKLSKAEAVPISGDTGIADIERIVKEEKFAPIADLKGTISTFDITDEYVKHVKKFAHLKRPIKIVADMGNSMGILESKALEGIIDFKPMFDVLDGTFPNHEANPLDHETLKALQKEVRSGSYDFGVSFDGDADRVGFVDEKGDIIPMDIVTALIAKDLLLKEKGVIFYDLRSSWAVKEEIEAAGGTPMMSRVGHTFIKQQMREHNAIFAGEVSGHYYFRDNYTTESSSMAIICVANIVSASNKPLSELIKPIQRYFGSGEINSEVKDKQAVLDTLEKKYSDAKIFKLDGVSIEYSDWWFNVRCSNTEQFIRLNLEAKDKATMEAKRDEILAIIRG